VKCLPNPVGIHKFFKMEFYFLNFEIKFCPGEPKGEAGLALQIACSHSMFLYLKFVVMKQWCMHMRLKSAVTVHGHAQPPYLHHIRACRYTYAE
jgi:hypothetical protein